MMCDFQLVNFDYSFPLPLGRLRVTVQRWLSGCGYKDSCANCCSNEMKLWKSLYDFPHSFVSNLSIDASLNYDDDDLSAWEFEANRWARVLFLSIKEEHPLEPILMVCFFFFLCNIYDFLFTPSEYSAF